MKYQIRLAMIVSKIATEDYIYFNLHAEEVINSNFIEEDNIGIYGDRLQISTFERVVESVKDSNEGKPCNIIFDFSLINACQPNLHKLIFELKIAGYKILFVNIKKALTEELSLTSVTNLKNSVNGDFYEKFYFFDDVNAPFTEVSIDIAKLFKVTFQEKISGFIDPHTKPHTSSFVYLTSYVDIKKFLSHEKEFMLFALYKLAVKIRKEWEQDIDKSPILICQSMNSAFIVSFLSNILKLDLLILDKIGPINKLYNRMDSTIQANKKYIVVSDLVCLGTEVKIVKNLIQFIGGKYLGNVSLIKTETLSKSDIKRKDATLAVFSINKTNNKELKYNIKTDLEQF